MTQQSSAPRRTRARPEPLGIYPFSLEKVASAGFVKRLLLRFFPLHFLETVGFEFRNTWLRLLAPLRAGRYRGETGMLVHVGCGKHGRDGWVNMDCFPGKRVNCLHDIRKNLPFDDQSVRYIFTEHVVEHLDYTEEIPVFIAECFRTLAPGGVLRIIVPDAEKYLRAYAQGGWSGFEPVRPLVDGADRWFKHKYHTPMELVNAIFHQGQQHRFAYDAATLEFLLKRAGFTQVTQQEFGKTAGPVVCLDTPDRATESLYMEAVK
jgi:predicted SAM-dependent methyltransferase